MVACPALSRDKNLAFTVTRHTTTPTSLARRCFGLRMFAMAEAPKKPKKRLSEAARKRRIESSRARDRTRINVGPAFTRWRELRDRTGCKTDADLAVLVLD